MTLNFKTKGEMVYNRLRSNIIDGKLKPGQKIILSALAKDFGFSVIPIREAMKKLESEGFLLIEPHVGAVVTKYDPGETAEIYRVRVELECIAAKWAIPHIGDADLSALEKLICQMDAAVARKEYGRLNALNKSFHLKMYQPCPNSFLCKLIEELWDKHHRRNLFAFASERALGSLKEHKEMVQAIRNQDAALLDSLLRGQKKESLVALMRNLQAGVEAEPSPPRIRPFRRKRE